MLDYNRIKTENNICIKIGSADTFRLAEMMGAIGFNKDSSCFVLGAVNGQSHIEKGIVIFENGSSVSVIP